MKFEFLPKDYVIPRVHLIDVDYDELNSNQQIIVLSRNNKGTTIVFQSYSCASSLFGSKESTYFLSGIYPYLVHSFACMEFVSCLSSSAIPQLLRWSKKLRKPTSKHFLDRKGNSGSCAKTATWRRSEWTMSDMLEYEFQYQYIALGWVCRSIVFNIITNGVL